MARIVGAIGSSHAPSIAFAYDAGHGERPEWKGLFEAYAPVRDWLRQVAADTLVFVYNDHLNNFQFDNYPSFALGTGEQHRVFGEGKMPRPLPAQVQGNSALAWQLARGLVADEFDPSLCLDLALDHGVMSVLPLLAPPPYGVSVIPLAVNVVLEPMPTPRRCWKLGQSIARAVQATPGDARVVVVATGGLSHQLHGDCFGDTNPAWDQRFLDLLERDPEALADITHQELIERGGAEAVEMMVWLTMRASLGTERPPRRVQRYYDAPKLTGYGLLALEPAS
ncbi:MAG: protocatechuate 3,4-dioxygenase [Hydrogenophaga sp.]|uniref:class III extradiol dioxygenase family protein n=1 Tax=Hydrogenophaga sp. TaxID=1904254 RepID=UPI00257FAD82|nr:class III extradiol dioxygenase family protein [Hydrogenophaga sp.]MBL0945144.1 protocatechuate 3,4-dioxygenase [Hydrogenophaga sp.]